MGPENINNSVGVGQLNVKTNNFKVSFDVRKTQVHCWGSFKWFLRGLPLSFRALCASAHVTVSGPASPSSCLTLFGKGFQRWQNVFLEVERVYGQVCKCLWPPVVLYDHGFSAGHLSKLNPRGACRVNPAESWKPSVPRGLLQVFLGHSMSPAVSSEIKWAAVTQL